MSMDLTILGIRKLSSVETVLLTGKSSDEICASDLFRRIYPAAPARSGYQLFHKYDGSLCSIRHMVTPIVTEEDDAEYGETSYIFWKEDLGHYWRSMTRDYPEIDEILTAVRGYMQFDQAYSPVPYGLVSSYVNLHEPTCPEEEIIAISYG